MRLTPFELGGATYQLLLNGSALFQIYDKFGHEGSVSDPIKGNDQKSFEAVCWYLFKLAEQGELYRRFEGQTPLPMPKENFFQLCLSPLDVPRAKAAIQEAILAGFTREEEPPPGTVDLFRAEWEKKTEEN